MSKEMHQNVKDFKHYPPQLLQKDESAICPHCWFEFLPKDAYFIAEHPDLIGGPVLENKAKLRLSPSEVKVDSKGRVVDTKGWHVVDRACPRCHLQIPLELLEKRPIFLSVAGPKSGGKTYFLTVMLHVLRQQLNTKFNLSFDYSDIKGVKIFTDLEDKLFNKGTDEITVLAKTPDRGVFNNVKLDGVDVELPKPFLFSMRPTSICIEDEIKKKDLYQTFALYDIAGELFELGRERDSTVRATGHLGVSDAIMFLFDPLQDEKTQLKLIENGNKDPGLKQFFDTKKIEPQDKMLLSVITNAKRLRSLTHSEKINIPLLVCVQKFDVWKDLLPKWAEIEDNTIQPFDKLGTSAVNFPEINCQSLLIRAFINDISPSFINNAESNFTSIRFFSVSAFGSSPEFSESEGNFGIRSGNLQPFRVTDPILWFMQKLELLRSAIGENNCSNTAKVISKDNEGFVVRFPDSGNRVKLDWQYEGLLVKDPWNGKHVAIPTRSSIMAT